MAEVNQRGCIETRSRAYHRADPVLPQTGILLLEAGKNRAG